MLKAPDTGNHIPVRNSHARRNNRQEDDPGAVRTENSMSETICIYLIRCSDGWMRWEQDYEEAVRLAEDHIKGTDLTYVIN